MKKVLPFLALICAFTVIGCGGDTKTSPAAGTTSGPSGAGTLPGGTSAGPPVSKPK